MSRKFAGIGVCPGVAFAPVYKIEIKESATDLDVTWQEISAALEKSAQYLEEKAQKIDLQVAKEVLEAQSLMARDPDLIEKIKNTMGDSKKSARNVLNSTLEEFKNNLLSLGDYFAERVADIDEIKKLTLNNIFGIEQIDLKINSNSIVVANDLSPADTASMNLNYVKGLVVAKGGPTSHTAIVARNLGIPAIVGCKDIEDLKNGVQVLINGRNGVVIENPDKNLVTQELNKENEFKAKFKSVSGPGKLKDNTAINLLANCGNIEDAKKAIINEAEGIGLFRTELLYLNQAHAPNISEQFQAYKKVAEAMGKRPVTIRTLDSGADKQTALDNKKVSPNPALGLRAIRLCLSEPKVFMTQLRAILRASQFGNIKILFPMLSSISELRQTKLILERAKASLRKEKIKFNEKILIGGMIEIPAAAISADIFAQELDFLSIGTNDLIQYALAIDRTDDAVSHLYNPLHPAVLKLIALTIKSAHKYKKSIAICGEMAGEPKLTKLLIAMGVEQLSMHPSHILSVKQQVLNSSIKNMKTSVLKLLNLNEVDKIETLLKKINQSV